MNAVVARPLELLRERFAGRSDLYLDERRRWVKEPLTDEILENHLRGKQRIGIAPREQTSYSLIDLDGKVREAKPGRPPKPADPDGAWQNTLAVAAIYESLDMAPLLELSRSGDGYHAIVLFDPADLPTVGEARELSRAVLRSVGLPDDGDEGKDHPGIFPHPAGHKAVGRTAFLPWAGLLNSGSSSLFVGTDRVPLDRQESALEDAQLVTRAQVLEATAKLHAESSPAPAPTTTLTTHFPATSQSDVPRHDRLRSITMARAGDGIPPDENLRKALDSPEGRELVAEGRQDEIENMVRGAYQRIDNQRGPIEIPKDTVDDDVDDGPAPQLPDELFCGPVADYVNALQETTEASPNYHWMTLLTVAGAIVGRRARTYQGGRIYPNIYGVAVGPSGIGRKTASQNLGLELIEDYQEIETLDSGSFEGILAALAGEQKRVLVTLSEMRYLLAKARQQSTSTIIPGLTGLYDGKARVAHRLKSKSDSLELVDPFLSILSCSTPEWLRSYLEHQDVTGGFLNRWWLIDGERGELIPEAVPPRPSPWERVKHALREMDDWIGAYAASAQELDMRRNDEAKELFDPFYRDVEGKPKDEEEHSDMNSRLQIHALKVSMIYALLARRTEINHEDMQRGISFAYWQRDAYRRILKGLGDPRAVKIEDKFMSVLRRFHQKKQKPALRQIQQAVRKVDGQKVTAEEFNRTARALSGEAGRIRIDPETKTVVELKSC